MADLRHWLIGSRAAALLPRRFSDQGLAARIADIIARDPAIQPLLDEADHAARFLPQSGWRERLLAHRPLTLGERFLDEIRQIVLQAPQRFEEGYSLESHPAALASAPAMSAALERLRAAIEMLRARLAELDDNMLVSILRVLGRVSQYELPVWIAMSSRAAQSGGLVQWVDRFIIERRDGQEIDIGMVRHALDPGRAFAQHILAKSKVALITSASLAHHLDKNSDHMRAARSSAMRQKDWQSIDWQTGMRHLPVQPKHIDVASSFDYAKAARIFIVQDVARATDAIAEAMAALFCASKGGALGLWTAVRRLRAAHPLIAHKLRAHGLLLLSQHDSMALPALMDIFREEESSCLLGTDALRDGIDVPGKALRLIVFERVPWPRPDILHQKRRQLFHPRAYDDMIAGLRLQQAFGRLIRNEQDSGAFVLLDRRFPSRLERFFPQAVSVERLTLAESLEQIKRFIHA